MNNIKIPSEEKPIHKLIDLAGSQSDLARIIKTSRCNVWGWLHRSEKIPADRIFQIINGFKAAGVTLTVHDIRPDLDS